MENKLLLSAQQLTGNTNFAIGNDLVFLPAFKESLNPIFIKKTYTAGEIEYCEAFDNSSMRYASTWAAKEAVYKAAKQLNPAALTWRKIEIVREKPAGRPYALIHQYPHSFKISLTISHDGDYIWALAFIENNPQS